jgi:hypothetical protein
LKYYEIKVIKKKLVKYRWHEANLTKLGKNNHIISMERSIALTRAFLNLSIEDIFPSLKNKKEDRIAFALAYKRLFEEIIKENMPEVRHIAYFYLQKAKELEPDIITDNEIELLRKKPWLYERLSENSFSIRKIKRFFLGS